MNLKQYHSIGYVFEGRDVNTSQVVFDNFVCFSSSFSCVEDVCHDVLEMARVY